MALPLEISEQDVAGFGQQVSFTGVVEAIDDPLTLGRVKVRIFYYHSENKNELPTKDLPWATVLLPTTSAGVGGQGSTVNLKPDSWVAGYFLDGRNAQYPIIIGVIPRVERPAQASDSGNTGGGYSGDGKNQYSTEQGNKPYYGQSSENPSKSDVALPNNPGKGAVTGDDGAHLSDANKDNWPTKTYTYQDFRGASSGGGRGSAKGSGPMRLHRASVLAMDAVAKDVGKYNITSAYRSQGYNSGKKGAASSSQHILGRAFDVAVPRGSRAKFIQAAFDRGFVSFGDYGSFVHIDTRERGGTKWVGTGGDGAWLNKVLKQIGWYPGVKPFRNVKTQSGDVKEPAENAGSSEDPNDKQAADNAGSSRDPNDTTTNQDSVINPGSSRDSNGDYGNFKISNNDTVATNQKAIIDEFRNAGYTDTQISGVLAAASNESGFNVNTIGDKNLGVGNEAHGLFQWRQDRWQGLQNYAASQGASWSDPNIQAQYAIKELSGNANGGPQLRAASTPTQAAAAMGMFERYKNYQSNNRDAGLAEKIASGGDMGGFVSKNSQVASNNTGNNTGFKDPANASNPAYKGKPTTNMAARGENGGGAWAGYNSSDTTNGFVIPGAGTFGMPESAASPKYPFNHIVYASRTGHMLEMDDSPQAERINLKHKTGTKLEFFPGGTSYYKINGNAYQSVSHNSYTGVVGDYYLSSAGQMNIRTTADLAIHSDGSQMVLTYNDKTEKTAGKQDLLVGDVYQVKAKKIIIEAGDIDFYATGNIKFHSEKSIQFKSKEAMRLTAKALDIVGKDTMQMKVNTDFKFHTTGKYEVRADKEMKFHSEKTLEVWTRKKQKYKSEEENINIYSEGSPNKADPPFVAGAEKAGKIDPAAQPKEADDAASTDLGKPLKRRTIEAQKGKKDNPDISIVAASIKAYSEG